MGAAQGHREAPSASEKRKSTESDLDETETCSSPKKQKLSDDELKEIVKGLDELPPSIDGLNVWIRVPDTDSKIGGLDFVATECGKAGIVFGNRCVNFKEESNEEIRRWIERLVAREGTVVRGEVTFCKNGKILHISEDALVAFSDDEPLIPFGFRCGRYFLPLPVNIKGLPVEERKACVKNGLDFVTLKSGQSGYVFGDLAVNFTYHSAEQVMCLMERTKREGVLLRGILEFKDVGKGIVSEDALVSFGESEPLFPIGYVFHRLLQFDDSDSENDSSDSENDSSDSENDDSDSNVPN